MALLDAYGHPIIPAELIREKATPTLTGIRRIWDDTVASGLTPQRLATLLRSAAEGDADAYLTLAEEMEERDLHYACELSKRKLAVGRLPSTIEAAADDQKSIDIADACRALVKGPAFRTLVKDLLDGLGKGFSVSEIVWDRSGARWKPARFEWRDPHFFQFDLLTRREIRLRDEADLINGLALTPYGFITHTPRIKSGLPLRGGLARLSAWAFMCKSYAVKDWLAFAEIYGMPLRLGKYGAGASEPDKDVLRMAVANLGVDAAAIFPDSMQIELIERKSSGGESVFQILAEYLDAQISKGILGQTASSAGGAAGLGNDKLQSDVRDDIRDDDAEQLEATLQRDLIVPFVDLNWGPQEEYPSLQLRAVENEDIKALAEALKIFVPLGLRVEQSVVRDKLGLPDPDKDVRPEDLLGQIPPGPPLSKGGANTPPTLEKGGAEGGGIATNAQQPCTCPTCATARNAEERAKDFSPLQPDTVASIAATIDNVPAETMLLERIRTLMDGARNLEEIRDGLAGLFDGAASQGLGKELAKAMILANLAGRYEVSNGD